MGSTVLDFVIRIKNAAMASRKEVLLPYSKLNLGISKVLVEEGFLEDAKIQTQEGKKNILAKVKYERRRPILIGVRIISRPSLRIFDKSKSIMDLGRKGKRTIIVSTSKGVMTGREAAKKGIGGEVLFAIW